MRMKKIIIVLTLLLNAFMVSAWADSFVLQKIEVHGLQRISAETFFNYLPVKRGQVVSSDKTASIIKALHKTGFFDSISLGRQGNVLVIRVVERPTIGQLKIAGNSAIPTDKLTSVMKSLDVAEGRVYNRVVIERIKQSLLNQYYQLGRYNARVDVTTKPMERNRILVKIDISEGLPAKIRRINIIGNKAFSERILQKQLVITTPGLLTFFTQTDRYSQEKLEESLEKLRNFYLDHGYIKFAIKSSQVAITPDRKSIYLTIVISEGEPYKVKGYTLTGNLIVPREELTKDIKIRQGDTFSRQAIMDAEKSMSSVLGDKGYIFAGITLRPTVDENAKQVFLTFDIKPGKRAYVRRISFSENAKTNDEALRREVQQMESAVVSTSKLEDTKLRLNRLPYIKNAQMTVASVEGSDDQVDVNYKVVEDGGAQATFSVGYSQLDHVILSAGLNQKNFLGTGNTLGFNVSRSRAQRFVGINYENPYYTADGISRSINLSASEFDPGKVNISSSYSTSQYDASMMYGIPIGQEQGVFNRVQLGYGYERTLVQLNRDPTSVSNQVNDFVNRHGSSFQQFQLMAGISRDSRDKSIFPTRGVLQTLGLNLYLPISGGLKYYTTAYNAKVYVPLNENFILTAKGTLAYGAGFNGAKDFPFFKNYYAGGPDSVRGYEGNSLGPKDSQGKASGGNALATASLGLIFPNYISENFRTSLFVEGGNVYNTYNNRSLGGTGSGSIRYSTGIDGAWLTPFGLIDVMLSKPLNRQPGDRQEIFQFSLGANFG